MYFHEFVEEVGATYRKTNVWILSVKFVTGGKIGALEDATYMWLHGLCSRSSFQELQPSSVVLPLGPSWMAHIGQMLLISA